jgi:Alpha-galactosidase, CBM13 domain
MRSFGFSSGTGVVNRSVLAIVVLAMFAAGFAVTQLASAQTRDNGRQNALECRPSNSPADVPTGGQTGSPASDAAVPLTDGYDPTSPGPAARASQGDPGAHDHSGDNDKTCKPGQGVSPGTSGPAGTPSIGPSGSPAPLVPLGRDCAGSNLAPHDGFQAGPRCVSTAFGEVTAAKDNPSLLIVSAPSQVDSGRPFTIEVSTRNLVRNRFLAAKNGGYYLERAFLNEEGLTRGHFHTACRMLNGDDQAQDPAPVPAFFAATEDGAGGRTPDVVAVQVPGLTGPGIAQCSSWAGDGSHRIPMMERANQTPAFDSVRIQVLAPAPAGGASFSVVSAGTTLTGTATLADCPSCAGGRQVMFLGDGLGQVQFNGVVSGSNGDVKIFIGYANGHGSPRSLDLIVNGAPATTLTFPPTGGWQTFKQLPVTVTLLNGTNTLKIASGSAFSIGLDKIIVRPAT